MTIELDNISLRREGVVFLDRVSLSIEKGGFNILLGPTLSGKTTLLRTMAGLEKPDSGRVLENDVDVSDVPVQKRNVAMVYQQFINYPTMTAFENIASPLKVAGLKREETTRRVGEVAALLRIDDLLNRRPAELSGGQQQRIALARALVKRAGLVLLDEPLANLDYKLREELRNELPRLFEDSGATVVYATAEPAEALMLGGRTATLHQGRVTQFGVTHEVFRNPDDLITARTFSDPPLNVTRAVKRGNQRMIPETASWPAGTSHARLPDGEYQLAFRPHHLSLGPPRASAIQLEGSVEIAEISGSETFVHLDIGGHLWISQSHGIPQIETGQTVGVSVNPDRFIFFTPDGRRVNVET